MKYIRDISGSFCNINQPTQALQRHPIRPTDYDHDWCRDKIEYEINISVEYGEE